MYQVLQGMPFSKACICNGVRIFNDKDFVNIMRLIKIQIINILIHKMKNSALIMAVAALLMTSTSNA